MALNIYYFFLFLKNSQETFLILELIVTQIIVVTIGKNTLKKDRLRKSY